jgi:eukaryotic-like serine/threonine-protein kinase
MTNQFDFTGQRLGNYRLIRLLGEGGFAEVYLGEHIHLKTLAAVKLLHTRLANDDIENFRREAQTIARLIHPHIVRVLDFGVEGNAPYLVMDFAPYGTLHNRHPKGTRLPLASIVNYVKQVAEALYYAHSQRLIHRDIKPENMLVGRNNEILLSDFGIALTSQSSSYQSTKDVAGTIAYMAPEQIQAHPRPASDQYSLAVVVYEWLSGNRPFQGTYTEIAIKHTMVPPPPLRSQVMEITPWLEEVVMKALQKDPQQRFTDVRYFAAALEQASLNRSYNAPTPVFVQPIPEPAYGMTIQQPPSNMPVYSHSANQPIPVDSSYGVNTPSGLLSNQYNSQAASTPGSLPEAQQPYMGTAAPLQHPMPQPQRRVSRRTVFAGLLLAAVGSGATWYILSQKSSISTSTQGTGLTSSTGGSSATASSGSTPAPASPGALVSYQGHSDYIWSVAWSPDGAYIVSCSQDGTAQVWTASNGKRQLSTRSHISPAIADDFAKAVVWSPTSKQILTGFQDGTAESLDIVNRQLSAVYRGDASWSANAVAWSPNGKYIAVGRFDNTVIIYEANGGKALLTYNGHNDGVIALAWSHDGKRIASGSSDGTAQVWRSSDGHPLLINKNHGNDVRSVSWSPDDTRIVSGGWDGTAQVWDSTTGHTLLIYQKHTGGMVNAVAWSHNSRYIASGGNDVYTHIWEAANGNILQKYYTFPIFSLAWAPDDSRIVTGGYNKIALVWSAR